MENGESPKRRRIYSLWDAYNNCDFVLYPTELEGFGNQFLEAVYFKKPVITTPYPVFKSDIAPLGFKVIEMEKNRMAKAVGKTLKLMANPGDMQTMVEDNFQLGQKYFSFEATREKLKKVLNSF